MVVKVQFEGTVKRVYEETRGQRTNKYVVVTDGRDQFPNVLRFKSKPDSSVNVAEGAKVKVEAYLDGREWAREDGTLLYFTDLTISTLDVLESPAPATVSADGENVTDWKTLLAFALTLGEDEAAVTKRCQDYKAKVNRKFTADNYRAIAKSIADEHVTQGDGSAELLKDDDMPF